MAPISKSAILGPIFASGATKTPFQGRTCSPAIDEKKSIILNLFTVLNGSLLLMHLCFDA